MNKKRLVLVIIIFLLGGAGWLAILLTRDKDEDSFLSNSTPQSTQNSENIVDEPQGFNKNLYKLDEPGSPWWVVNKTRPLPAGYVPKDLVEPSLPHYFSPGSEQRQISKSVLPALVEMFNAANLEGVRLVFGSGFRSEGYQRGLYNKYVSQDGQAAADKYSARPGYSEHQTGLTFDATASDGKCHLEQCFQDTSEGKWLSENAYKYGFIIRYVEGKDAITGYEYEPWHMRYIGKELSAEMQRTGILTLEEFFGLPAAPNY